MNAKQVLGALLLMVVFAVGCKPENYTRSSANSAPTPQKVIQLSEPTKVSLSGSAVNLERLGYRFFNGNLLVASTTISGTIHWLTINLENSQVRGPQPSLQMDSLSATTGRYLPHSTSYYNENIKQQAGELFVYDFQKGTEFQIANNQPGLASASGNRVVWGGYDEGGWNIYAYDIVTQQTVTITHGAEGRSYPYIADDWVIYLDMGKDKILHAYNLSTQEALTLSAVPHPRGREGKYHLISDGKVVWADAETYDLHVLDLNTRAIEVITDPVTTCKPLYYLDSLVRNTLLYRGCESWVLYDLDSKASVNIPVLPPEIREMMAQNKNNEDAMYGVNWIGMSDTRLAWTVIDSLGHSWLYTSRIER